MASLPTLVDPNNGFELLQSNLLNTMDHPVEAKATRKRTIDTADDDGDADAVALTDAKRRKPSVAGEARGNRAAGLRLGSKLSAVSVRVKPADRRRRQQQLEQDSEDSEQFDEATGESDGVEDDHRQLFSPLPLEETIVDGDGNANGDVVDNDADVDAGDDDAVTLTADELRAKQFDKFVDMMLFGRVRTRFAAADRIMRALRKGGLTPERLAEMPKKSLMAMLMGVQFGAAVSKMLVGC